MGMERKQIKKIATAAQLKQRKPRVGWFQLHLDDELAEEVERLRADRARWQRDHAEVPVEGWPGAADLEAAEEALDEVTVYVRLEALGSRYEDLIGEHTMDDDRRTEMAETEGVEEKDLPAWDPDTFPPALVAASIVEPEIPADEFDDWYAALNVAEKTALFTTALRINTTRRLVSVGNG